MFPKQQVCNSQATLWLWTVSQIRRLVFRFREGEVETNSQGTRVLYLLLCMLHRGRIDKGRKKKTHKVQVPRSSLDYVCGSPSSLPSSSWLLHWYWQEMLSCNEKRAKKHFATHLAASVTSLLLFRCLCCC
jgi:hypothetical protein